MNGKHEFGPGTKWECFECEQEIDRRGECACGYWPDMDEKAGEGETPLPAYFFAPVGMAA